MNLIHIKNTEIRTDQCDNSGKLTLTSLLNMLQTAAGEHADILHFGISELNKENDTWVLSRLRVDIEIWPKAGDTVTLKTWPKGVDRMFAIRDFMLLDSQGNCIIRAASYWLVIDRTSKRPKLIANTFKELDYPELSAINEKLEKIPAPQTIEFSSERKVSGSEIDINGHVNNVHYAGWIWDTLPSTLKNREIHRFEINYLAEVFADEIINISIGKSPEDDHQTLAVIFRDNKEVCRARLMFQ